MGKPKYKTGFSFAIHEDAIDLPLKWKAPRKIFVNSMSDLFHELMPDSFLEECFATMKKADWHIYQILTKRPERMLAFAKKHNNIPDHIWMGTSVESALYVPRIDLLRKVPCKVKFVSFEPLLGSVGKVDLSGVSWVIVGGESGPHFREMKSEWVREIRHLCKQQKVAFFFKQWGGRTPKSGGRELDGKKWDEYPTPMSKKGLAMFPTAK